MTEQVWKASEIERWDEESLMRGFKVGPVERPSTLPAFWNEAQAERWAAAGFPRIEDSFARWEWA